MVLVSSKFDFLAEVFNINKHLVLLEAGRIELLVYPLNLFFLQRFFR